MRSVEYADAVFDLPSEGDGGTAGEDEIGGMKNKRRRYFLKSRSKASRASLALRGGGVFRPACRGPAPPP